MQPGACPIAFNKLQPQGLDMQLVGFSRLVTAGGGSLDRFRFILRCRQFFQVVNDIVGQSLVRLDPGDQASAE